VAVFDPPESDLLGAWLRRKRRDVRRARGALRRAAREAQEREARPRRQAAPRRRAPFDAGESDLLSSGALADAIRRSERAQRRLRRSLPGTLEADPRLPPPEPHQAFGPLESGREPIMELLKGADPSRVAPWSGTGRLSAASPVLPEGHLAELRFEEALRSQGSGPSGVLAPLAAVADSSFVNKALQEIGGAGIAATAPALSAFVDQTDEGKELLRNAARDAQELPANVVPSTYYTGKALVDAAQGDTEGVEQIASDFVNTSPLALLAQGRVREAGEQAYEHPLLTGLEVGGVGSGLSYLGARAAGVSRRRLPDRRVPGTNIVDRRYGPAGLFGVWNQRRHDAAARERYDDLAAQAERREAAGDREGAALKRREAARAHPDRVPERVVQRQVDTLHQGRHQSVRRPHNAARRREVRRIYKSVPRRQAPLVGLVARGVVDADAGDIRAYLGEIRAERAGLESRAQRQANRRLERDIAAATRDGVSEGALGDAARAYATLRRGQDDDLVLGRDGIGGGMLDQYEARMARLIPYAARRIGVERIDGVGIVRRSDGDAARAAVAELREAQREQGRSGPTPENRARVTDAQRAVSAHVLRPEEIEAHARHADRDPDAFAFISQAPRGLGDRAHNVTAYSAPGVSRRSLTGRATTGGLIDAHPERMVDQAVKAQGLVDARNTWARAVATFFLRDRDGEIERFEGTPEQARKKAEEMVLDEDGNPIPAAHPMRAVRLNPWMGREGQLARTLEEADREGFVGDDVRGGVTPVQEAIEAALKGEGDGEWGFVPEVVAERIAEHSRVAQSGSPLMRAVGQAFRRTVLPLSPAWLTGNTVEAALRSLFEQAGPRSWLDYRRVYVEMALDEDGAGTVRRALRRLPDPKPGSPAESLLHMTPDGHYGGGMDTMIRTTAGQFTNTRLEPLVNAWLRLSNAGKAGRAAGRVPRAYSAYSDWVMGTLARGIEGQATRAMAGRYMRRHLMSKKDRLNAETAISQAVRGMKETPEQIAMGEWVRKVYGQYESFSPAMRRLTQNYTPFVAWGLNAIRFLYWHMPKDHPVLTGLLASQQRIAEEFLEDEGLSYWAENALPPWLQGSVPLPGGGHLRLMRYTPFGFAADPAGWVAGVVLPQYQGFLMTQHGLDWKGAQLRDKDGEPIDDPYKLGLIGVRETLYALVPGIALGTRLAEDGPSTLNPFRPVEPPPGSSTSTSGARPSASDIARQSQSRRTSGRPSASEIARQSPR
jgi:hypothetical protein